MIMKTKRITGAPDGDRREVQWKDIGSLRLDPKNPRLREGLEEATQPALLAELAKEYDLQDLGQSLADNGYFSEEPLVTTMDAGGRSWTVIEGNRRLAALLLLNNPDAAPKTLKAKWQELSKNRIKKVTQVPILVYDSRSEITPYLGFRHITGVLQWRPFQKARYIVQLVEEGHMSFAAIARAIGSRSPTVREHYVAYALVRQARDQFVVDTSYVEESFGVLRRALSDPAIREYIGLEYDQNESKLAKPIPKSKVRALEEFFLWAFGNDQVEPAIKDSRDLSKLGRVLSSAHTVEILRSSKSLDRAFELSGGEEEKLLESLNAASFNLDQALPLSLRHRKNKKVLAAVDRCHQTLKAILEQMATERK